MKIQTSFFGKLIPSSIWNSDVLHLSPALLRAHRELLEEQSWLDKYNPRTDGGAGGADQESAQEHVINRFLNSAARMQYVCADPRGEHGTVREMVLNQLGDGAIHVLDLAAGNGAGTLAILSLLAELRRESLIPKLPLNVVITALDFSTDALQYYSEILVKIDSWLKSNGLNIELFLSPCDLSIHSDFSQELENFFDGAKKKNISRFFCVISAVSGVKKEGMLSIYDSLNWTAASLSHKNRNSSLLWVEPKVVKPWFFELADSIRLTLQGIKNKLIQKGDTFEIHTDGKASQVPEARSFFWHDPYFKSAIKSHVVVMDFRNNYGG